MSSIQIASFRKVSAGILASAHLAGQDERPEVSKRELSLVLKRVAPALGIDGTAYHVLDILLGLVQADDFQPARRPVVAISNQRLADYTRRTPRTVTRCLKKLVEAGILAYRDSPTGRRFVYRGRGGEPEQAYGLDFTPACHNLEYFQQQAAAFQDMVKRRQAAKRTVTRLSRALADLAEATAGEYQLYVDQAAFLIKKHGTDTETAAADLTALYDEALSAFELENKAKMSCAGDIDVSPLSITTHPDSIVSNNKRPRSNEREHQFTPDNGDAVELALEREPCGAGSDPQHPSNPAGSSNPKQKVPAMGAAAGQTNLDGVRIGLISGACSTLKADMGIHWRTWPELCDQADTLRVLIGLSPSGYQDAVTRQGKYLAAACLAVVAEKALRDPEQISSPGGYFRAMIDRAGEGRLYLAKSLHGLIQG